MILLDASALQRSIYRHLLPAAIAVWAVSFARDIDECQLGFCQNGGACLNTNGSYYCLCLDGYEGRNCSEEYDRCDRLKPCKNGGTCLYTSGVYTCECLPTFKDNDCVNDVDECLRHTPPCLNAAFCHNTFGGYTCTCTSGFDGVNCEHAIFPDTTGLGIGLGAGIGGAFLVVFLVIGGFYIYRRRQRGYGWGSNGSSEKEPSYYPPSSRGLDSFSIGVSDTESRYATLHLKTMDSTITDYETLSNPTIASRSASRHETTNLSHVRVPAPSVEPFMPSMDF